MPAASSSNRPTNHPGFGAWFMLAPMILWLLVFVIAPNAVLLVYSFGQTDDVGRVIPPADRHEALDNYRRVAVHPYPDILLRSVIYAGIATVACVLIGYPIALFIGRAPGKWRHWLLMAVMVPFWTSFLIRTYAWVTILSTDGILAGVLRHFHINGTIDILYTPTAVMIGLVYTYLPFMILPIYGSVQKLDGDLVEASYDLGAGPFKTLIKVIWPLTWPGVAAGIVLTFVPAIAMFAVNDLLGGGKVVMIGNAIETQFNTSRDWPFGSALGMVVTVLFAVLFAFAARRRDAVTP